MNEYVFVININHRNHTATIKSNSRTEAEQVLASSLSDFTILFVWENNKLLE